MRPFLALMVVAFVVVLGLGVTYGPVYYSEAKAACEANGGKYERINGGKSTLTCIK